MKKILLISLIALLALPLSAQMGRKHVIPLSQERSRDFDASHYRIELSVDPEKKYLQGQNTITLFPLRNGLGEIKLDAQSLVVKEIIDMKGKKLKYDQTENNILNP